MFDSRAGVIKRRVANGSPSLRHFFKAVLPRRCAAKVGPALKYDEDLIFTLSLITVHKLSF